MESQVGLQGGGDGLQVCVCVCPTHTTRKSNPRRAMWGGEGRAVTLHPPLPPPPSVCGGAGEGGDGRVWQTSANRFNSCESSERGDGWMEGGMVCVSLIEAVVIHIKSKCSVCALKNVRGQA
eukprot:TRINITY_DN12963_c0_g1_i1.p1 TRINITY_DN12963_c0_g1~~TRINITY_DN12963_c0_g1_i1.p1  ORF type:complete len:122 (+),score=5.15 TRINITY_DN12963_c0_g1_i1:717-1082(+)